MVMMFGCWRVPAAFTSRISRSFNSLARRVPTSSSRTVFTAPCDRSRVHAAVDDAHAAAAQHFDSFVPAKARDHGSADYIAVSQQASLTNNPGERNPILT